MEKPFKGFKLSDEEKVALEDIRKARSPDQQKLVDDLFKRLTAMTMDEAAPREPTSDFVRGRKHGHRRAGNALSGALALSLANQLSVAFAAIEAEDEGREDSANVTASAMVTLVDLVAMVIYAHYEPTTRAADRYLIETFAQRLDSRLQTLRSGRSHPFRDHLIRTWGE